MKKLFFTACMTMLLILFCSFNSVEAKTSFEQQLFYVKTYTIYSSDQICEYDLYYDSYSQQETAVLVGCEANPYNENGDFIGLAEDGDPYN